MAPGGCPDAVIALKKATTTGLSPSWFGIRARNMIPTDDYPYGDNDRDQHTDNAQDISGQCKSNEYSHLPGPS